MKSISTNKQIPRDDMLLLMADLNSMIGSCNKNREGTMGGVHGIREMNNKRERLANLCYEI